jgi:uncharacterized protein (DUF362 family)
MAGRWAREKIGKGISRRELLKITGTAALIAATGTLGCVKADDIKPDITPTPTEKGPTPSTASPPVMPKEKTLIIATDENPVKLVDKAIDAYGGLSDIIKSGDKVVLKANYSFARTQEQAACNHPDVLVRIMQRCKDAGAGDVVVMDYTLDSSVMCLERSGIGSALDKAGFKSISPSSSKMFTQKAMGGTYINDIRLANALLEADCFINVPVLKNHSGAKLTACMKNLMGVIYDRGAFHSEGSLDTNIAELANYVKPDLMILDAYRAMKTGGPGGSGSSQIIKPYTLIVGHDPVAIDSYGASIIGLDAKDIDYIGIANRLGIGEIDYNKLSIKRV